MRIVLVRCAHRKSGRGPEEYTRAPSLAFVRRGVFVRHLGGREQVAVANRVALFRSDRPYRVSHPTDDGDVCLSLAPGPDLLHALCEAHPDAMRHWTDDADLPEDIRCPADLFAAQSALVRDVRSGLLADVGVEERALDLIDRLLAFLERSRGQRLRRRAATRAAHRQAVEAVISRLACDPRSPTSLEALSREAHVSMFHLCRVFHEQTGMTIHGYRQQLRLRQALTALDEGCCDLTGLALKLGFSHHSHLTHAFRREFGVTPSAFRKRQGHLREMSKRLQV